MSIDKIEEKIAHQDKEIQDLSDIVFKQGKDIEALKAYIRTLEGKVEALKDDLQEGKDAPASVSEMAARDKPPHY
ncbi:MAG: SlyX family protein [Alphaproteobacteria bacterium]|nr:SlyX family protein [Alphaproteobacteria bacterium]